MSPDPRRSTARTRSAVAAALTLTMLGGLLSTGPAGPASAAGPGEADIAAEVTDLIEAKGAADVWLVFDDHADLRAATAIPDWTRRGQAVVDALQATAATSQATARSTLEAAGADYTPYWITNQIRVDGADRALVAELAGIDQVDRIVPDSAVPLLEPAPAAEVTSTGPAEWGIAAINADDVWAERADTGQGIVVANIDTGVQFDHPALAASYRGALADGYDHNYNWYDPTGLCTLAPCDNHGHGTHTMGTMVGDGGTGNRIGVAPGARWIAAKGCEGASCTSTSLLAAGQWMLAPTDLTGANPRADLRPNIVNSSWGEANGSAENPAYRDIIAAWRASGIFPAFANGNAGANGCDSASSPGDLTEAYAVGAFGSNGAIGSFSSRGPGENGTAKPDIAAPGVAVRSSWRGGGYATYSGTSMATPHLAAAVALLWAASPGLIGHVTETIALLDDTAIDVDDTSCGGTAADNNVWGQGRLDIAATIAAAPGTDAGALTGHVVDRATGEPVSGARISLTGASTRTVTAEADGTYQFSLVPGAYRLAVTAYGYDDGGQDLTVAAGQSVTVDLALQPRPVHAVSGAVTDPLGAPVAGIRVSVVNTPVPAATTDAAGRYTLPAVAEGSYRLTGHTTLPCLGSVTVDLVVDGAETADLVLNRAGDTFGYRCTTEPADYIPGTTLAGSMGDEVNREVALPFPFPFHHQVYTTAYAVSDGYLTFTGTGADAVWPYNTSLPNPAKPNAAIYATWDDWIVSSLWTAVVGEAPNRRFVLEFRHAVQFNTSSTPFNFEIVLSETTGEIVLAYQGINPTDAWATGTSATVGIEDATGTDALQVAQNGTATLSDATAIRITPEHTGVVQGVVRDANDGRPIPRATVTLSAGGDRIATATTDADGWYGLQAAAGPGYDLTADAGGHVTGFRTADLSPDGWTTVDVSLAAGALHGRAGGDLAPWVVPAGSTARQTFTLTNTGTEPLTFDTSERDAPARPSSRALGEVVTEIAAPDLTGLSGVTVDGEGDLWVNDTPTLRWTEFDRITGQPTGTTLRSPAANTGTYALTYDRRRNLLCQPTYVVGGSSLISCLDPVTGTASAPIDVTALGGGQMIGISYRADDDTFYVGSVSTGKIYQVAGPSAAKPGAQLAVCQWTAGVFGIAHHPGTGRLYLATRYGGTEDTLTEFDMSTCSVVRTIADPGPTIYSPRGLGIDPSGDLWTLSQPDRRIYRISTGTRSAPSNPWLSVTATDRTLGPGESTTVTVAADTTGRAPGTYRGYLEFTSDSGRPAPLVAPVTLVVPAYHRAIDAGAARPGVDSGGLAWAADHRYTTGGDGWTGPSRVVTDDSRAPVAGTADGFLYRTQRQGGGYRFDALPADTYQVTLDFAALRPNPHQFRRRDATTGRDGFDVLVNGTVVLAGYDPLTAAGPRTADRRTFLTTVAAGGRIDVTLRGRPGGEPGALAAVRVAQRPDL